MKYGNIIYIIQVTKKKIIMVYMYSMLFTGIGLNLVSFCCFCIFLHQKGNYIKVAFSVAETNNYHVWFLG